MCLVLTLSYCNAFYIKAYTPDTPYLQTELPAQKIIKIIDISVEEAVNTKSASMPTMPAMTVYETNSAVQNAETKNENEITIEITPSTESTTQTEDPDDTDSDDQSDAASTATLASYIIIAQTFKERGRYSGPMGIETYYDLPMEKIVMSMQQLGYTPDKGYYPWIRADGIKMYGAYVMVAADLNKYPRGTIVDCTFGPAIVCDTGDFVHNGSGVTLDIATTWCSQPIPNPDASSPPSVE